jgi:hypothetical protein
MAINRAMTTRQTLVMLPLDMRDAFSSVSHVQLRNNLYLLGFHPLHSEMIFDSYTHAKVRVITLNGATEPIEIIRGLKQGCPLSPIIFDICIEHLIEKLSSDGFKPFGYWWNINDGDIAQAYSDDILLCSRSYDDMMELVRVVQDFIMESNIQLNLKKCEMLKIG